MDEGMPKHGEFCWTEVATGDLDAAMNFYRTVFGWTFKENNSVGEGMRYEEFSAANGNPIGGMYKISAEMYGDNPPPPHLINYIAVDDVDATAARAPEIGGAVVSGPMDVPNVGRMAVLQDPTGAKFAIITLGGGA
ncbi:MAG: VOC family protein [Acidobacteria bacterium]|nr:VOC family protein [Acidobacteriota bacterium]MBK8810363.1 VOC family protein [Acidobacteriota bacterium]